MKSVLSTLIVLCSAGALLAPAARALPPLQDKPAEGQAAPAPDGQFPPPSEPTESVFPKPTAEQKPQAPPVPRTTDITDIGASRVEDLPYVRRHADIVRTDFGHVDINADPIMKIGERAVSRAEFRRRALMYMSGSEIDKEITRALTDQEMKRQIAAGVDPAAFAPDEAGIDQKLQDQKDLIAMNARQQAVNGANPQKNADEVAEGAIKEFIDSINNSPGGMADYRALLAADVQFEKVFLPFPKDKVEGVKHDPAAGPIPLDDPRPDWFPQTSWDAMGHDDGGRNLRSVVKGWAIDGEQIPGLFKPSIMDKLRSGLIDDLDVSFFFDDDLPGDAFLRVGGETIKVDDMWARANIQLADTDIDLILRELVMLDGMRASLDEAGRWMSREDFETAWQAHVAEYAPTIFPLRTIIIFKGYTSVDRYREHYRYRLSYNKWKKSTSTDEDLKKHFEQGGRLYYMRGDAVVDIGYAPLGEKPFNDANFAAATTDLGTAIDTAHADATPDGGSAWFAPVKTRFPAPVSGQSPDNIGFQRSQLRMEVAEDELSIFVTGYSIADDVIYHGKPGELFGPWPERCRRHAWGAEPNAGSWAVLVNGYRTRAALPAFEGPEKDLAWEDYVDLNYFYWSQECLKSQLEKVTVAQAAVGGEGPKFAAAPHRTWMYIVGTGAALVAVAAIRGGK